MACMLGDPVSARAVYITHEGVFAFAFMLAATVNLVWQASAGLTPLQLVLIGTVLELTAFLCEIPTGVVADVYSRRLSVIVGVLLYGGGWTLEGSFAGFWAFLLSQVLWGSGSTFISGAHTAWITDEVGEENVDRVLLRGAQAAQVGSILAVPVAVAMASVQLNYPIVAGGLLFFAIALFLILAMPERNFRPAPREGRSGYRTMVDTFLGGVRTVRGQPVLVTILAIGAVYGAASEGIDRLYTPHFLSFSFPAIGELQPIVWFGAISLGASLLAALATQLVLRRIDATDHRRTSRALFVISAFQIASVLAFALAGEFWIALGAYWSYAVFRRLTNPIYAAWLNQGLDPRYRATVLSFGGQVDALGQIAGGPVVGVIGTVASLRAALAVAGLVLAPALLLYARAIRQGRPPATVVEAGEP